MTRAGSGTTNGPGFPGAVVLAPSAPAADDRLMLLNAFTPAAPSPAHALDTGVADAVDAPMVTAPVAAPLQGRALLARLETLAQQELAGLAGSGVAACAGTVDPLDPALAGLAWDLGLSGDAIAMAARHQPDPA